MASKGRPVTTHNKAILAAVMSEAYRKFFVVSDGNFFQIPAEGEMYEKLQQEDGLPAGYKVNVAAVYVFLQSKKKEIKAYFEKGHKRLKMMPKPVVKQGRPFGKKGKFFKLINLSNHTYINYSSFAR